MSRIDLDGWVRAHPWLESLARFTAEVERAAAALDVSPAAIPEWGDYADEFDAGVPLLASTAAGIDLEAARETSAALAARISGPDGGSLPGPLAFIGWTAMRRQLAPLLHAFARWRDEERWMRPWCPACGSAPAMAQMLAEETGRVRHLCCGSCATRWRFVRTRCPFCDQDEQRLHSLAVEGEAGLRIDYCDSCRGYLKTYDGSGDEPVLLADWTSLHLDYAARDRGLKRLAGSLFDLETVSDGTGS